MVEEDKIVIFAMPEQITEATIGRLREFAGTVMVTRQQIKDHEEALLEYRKAEDVTAPVDLRAAIAGAIEHIHQLKDKLKALYAKDLGEVPDGF